LAKIDINHLESVNPNDDDMVARRSFLKGLAALSVTAGIGGIPLLEAAAGRTFDYIVVGAGPGGGPLAANLAKAGYTVALLEAGLDPGSATAQQQEPDVLGIYSVPAFVTIAEEDPLLSWDFYVNHYSENGQRDPKFVPGKGVLYPRGSCLGGSSAHNFMLFMYPHDADFDGIARLTGDESWSASNMRQYFERLESCQYLQAPAAGHGFNGYIPTSVFDHKVFDLYPEIKDLAFGGASLATSPGNPTADVNNPEVTTGETGWFLTPMHVDNTKHVRVSVREHLLETQANYPNNLFILTGALASKVLMKDRTAIGVEYMKGENLYSADKDFNSSVSGERMRIFAHREVILSGGAFNTPQLLKLSGIGPAAELRKFGIDVVADLPGVGANLQDRYEISIVTELNQDLGLMAACTPGQANDPCLNALETGNWTALPRDNPFFGTYANNTIFGTLIAKSSPEVELPDLYLVGFPLNYRGYFPGFSRTVFATNNWSWLILKAHNKNTAGTVTLRSTNPRDTPVINFNYFLEGNDKSGQDLDAVVQGFKLARQILSRPIVQQHVFQELLPGSDVQTDDQIREYVSNQAWGHHATCTAAIGAEDDPMAVLDGRFRVRGVRNLRVVDASVFPKIPGFFPVCAVTMISEKASDVILADAKKAKAES
jgi:choline dehydrogenase